MGAFTKDWAARSGDGPARPVIESFMVFGWLVHRHVMPPGASIVISASRQIDRADAPNIAIYVRGVASVANTLAGQLADRAPGMFTGDRPAHPAGVTTVTAIDEVEFWCFNRVANRRRLPVVQPLRVPSGGQVTLPAGTLVAICSGRLGGHGVGPVAADGDEWVADGDVYGFLIGEANA